MYNLKEVIGVISFEIKAIKVLVVDDCLTDEKKCLYFNKIEKNVFEKNSFKNLSEIKNLLNKELVNVDKFIGVRVKRYILCIPSMKEMMENSKKGKDGAYNDFINKIKFLFDELDTSLIDIIPLSKPFINLFETGTNNNLLIEVNEEWVKLTEYKDEKSVITSNCIDFGTNNLISYISEKLQIQNKNVILNLVKNFKYFNNIESNPPIINYHNDSFLKLMQLDLDSFKRFIVNLISLQLNKISLQIIDKNFNQIILTCSNEFFSFYEYAINKNLLVLNNKLIFLKKECILGLEEENLTEMLMAINYVLKKKRNRIWSIDPYFSEELNNKQLRNKLLLKLGIISTNLSAKLGSQKWE